MTSSSPQKLILMIVSDADSERLMTTLIHQGYPATKIGSTGGFLRRGNATILSGVEESEVDAVMNIVRNECRARTEYIPPQAIPFVGDTAMTTAPLPIRVGGAIIFVLAVERFEKT
jgi:uncharacterized protein YaaQ